MVPPTSHQSVPQVSSYQNAPVWQNDRTQPQYAVAGHYTRHESPHPDDLLSYPGRIPAFGRFTICTLSSFLQLVALKMIHVFQIITLLQLAV